MSELLEPLRTIEPVRIGINGFGRIGRQVAKIIMDEHSDLLEIVGVNDPAGLRVLANLYENDSIYGHLGREVDIDGDHVLVDGHPIRFSEERDPSNIRWDDVEAQMIIEASGFFSNPIWNAKTYFRCGRKSTSFCPS